MSASSKNSGTQDETLPRLLSRLWGHLSLRRKRQFILLAVLMPFGGVLEMVSLGAVLPFLGVITAPEKVFNHPTVSHLASTLGIGAADQLVLPVVIAFAASALAAGAIRIILLFAMTRVAFASGSDLSIEVYRRTLYQPYSAHIARNSSQIIAGITTKVGGSVNVLLQMLFLVNSILLVAFIVTTMILIEPAIATITAVGFGTSYGLVTWASRHRLYTNSRRIALGADKLQKVLQEGLGGIRDVLLDGTQSVYCDIYSQADRPLRKAQSSNSAIAGTPRFVMEALVIIFFTALAYWLSRKPDGISLVLPILGALALGAQRLLPVMQQSYYAWASIAGSQASLSDAIQLLDQPVSPHLEYRVAKPLQFENEIEFDSVYFRYSPESPWVINDLSICIPKGSRVGFIGTTGSGKSTTLDLFMGLLEPTMGKLLVDGRPIGDDIVRSWQRTIAHVPQSIYLADTTLAENIAFGIPRSEIAMDRVRSAARQAQIADFIERLPDAYDTLAGERGVRLSGGQRQRIGIARALYKDASVLVFDEATSALDDVTEQSVMDAIDELDRNLTILIIAHRLSTVRRCDTIVRLENGRMVACGQYAELIPES
jgi:ABC-type multidrug transport system fused ATPase/permease subunit